MKTIRFAGLCAFAVTIVLLRQTAADDDTAKATRVKVGEKAPDFTCKTIPGDEFSLAGQKGKVVLINFFATWCGPCLAELPQLEKEIVQKYADRKDFKVIVIGREHNAADLEKFAKEKKLPLPFAPDPKREIYGKYAEQFIPRNFVVGRDGKIKLASTGFDESHFQELIRTIENELKEPLAAR